MNTVVAGLKSKRAAKKVKNTMWDSRIYLNTGDFDAGFIATVTTRLLPRSRFLHVPRKISAMNPSAQPFLGLSDRGYARLF